MGAHISLLVLSCCDSNIHELKHSKTYTLAFSPSEDRFCWLHEKASGSWLPIKRSTTILISCRDVQADLSLRWHACDFAVLRVMLENRIEFTPDSVSKRGRLASC